MSWSCFGVCRHSWDCLMEKLLGSRRSHPELFRYLPVSHSSPEMALSQCQVATRVFWMGAYFRRWERNEHNRDEEGAALTGRRIKPLFTWFSLCQIQEYRQVLLQKIRWCSAAVWRYMREKLSQCTRMGGHDWGRASNPRSKQKITWESQAILEDAIVLLCWSTRQIGDRWSRLVRKDWLREGSVSWHVVILVSSSVAGTFPQSHGCHWRELLGIKLPVFLQIKSERLWK